MIVTSQPIKRKQQQKRKQQFWKKEWNGRRGTRTRSPWVKTFGFHRDLPLLPEMASAFFVRPLMFDISHQSPRLLHDTNGQHICLPEAQESDISDNRNKFPFQVSLMHGARFRIRKNILSFQADKAGTVIIYKICNRSPLLWFELRIVINGTKSREEVKLGNLAAISSILYMHHCTIDTIYICTRRPLMWIESCTKQDEVKLGNSKAIIKPPLSSPTPPC